jgi:cell division protein FtsX
MTEDEQRSYLNEYAEQVQKDKEWIINCENDKVEIRKKLENVKDVGDVEYKKKAEKSGLEVKQLDFKISTMGGV